MGNTINLLETIASSSIPESLKTIDLNTTLSETRTEPIVEKYIRLNNHLIRLERKAIPPKIRESTPVFRWRIPRVDCRHIPIEYDDYCGKTNIALDKLENYINGDIDWNEFLDAWKKAEEICPKLGNSKNI